jgi:hypothetical protein
MRLGKRRKRFGNVHNVTPWCAEGHFGTGHWSGFHGHFIGVFVLRFLQPIKASAEVPFTGKGMALNLHEASLVRETNDIIGCSLKAFKETHGENTRDR